MGGHAHYVRPGNAADLVSVGAIGVEQVRPNGSRSVRIGFRHAKIGTPIVVCGTAPGQEAIGDGHEPIVVVGMRRTGSRIHAINGLKTSDWVKVDLAGQRRALPLQCARAPAIDVVARIVGMPAAVEDQVAAIAVPAESTPCQDDLGRRMCSPVIQRFKIRRGPDAAVQICVDLEPRILRHLQNQRQQRTGVDIGWSGLSPGHAGKGDNRGGAPMPARRGVRAQCTSSCCCAC